MHRIGVKCVQVKACPCQADNHPSISVCPSEYCHNPGPTQYPIVPRLTTDIDSKHWGGPVSRPDPLLDHPPGRLSPRRTGVITQRSHESSGVAYLTGVRQHCPCGPRANRDRCPRPCHTDSHQERHKKLKVRTTNGWYNCFPQSACRTRQ